MGNGRKSGVDVEKILLRRGSGSVGLWILEGLGQNLRNKRAWTWKCKQENSYFCTVLLALSRHKSML